MTSIRAYDDGDDPPLGAACVAAAIRSMPVLAGRVSTRLVDAGPGERAEVLAGRIMSDDPDAVGFSLYCWNRKLAEKTAAILRRDRPELFLFAGGPEAEAYAGAGTAAGAGTPDDFPFDTVFIGEGEDAVPAWLEGVLDGHTVRGIVPRGLLPAPDRLPSPWLSGTIRPKRGGSAAWELTRGCPYSCAYCYEGRGSKAVRRLPESRVEEELALFARSGMGEVFVLDPTFNLDGKRALHLLDLFRKKAPSVKWQFEVRAELLDRAQAAAFARLDCFLQIGLQSADPEVLKRVGRTLDRNIFAEKLALLDREGVVYGLDLIYGLPGDSLEGFRSSVDYALMMGPNHVDIFPLSLLPGTQVAENMDRWNFDADPEPPYIVRGQPGFGPEDMCAASRLAQACSFFYSRGRAAPWFRPVLKPLRMRPSTFFEDFSLSKPGVTGAAPKLGTCVGHEAVEAIQIEYLERLYRARGLDRLVPAMLDLVRFNGAWSRALAEGKSTSLDLTYSAAAVSGPEILDLRRFSATFSPEYRRIRVEPSRDGPVVRISGTARRKNV